MKSLDGGGGGGGGDDDDEVGDVVDDMQLFWCSQSNIQETDLENRKIQQCERDETKV